MIDPILIALRLAAELRWFLGHQFVRFRQLRTDHRARDDPLRMLPDPVLVSTHWRPTKPANLLLLVGHTAFSAPKKEWPDLQYSKEPLPVQLDHAADT